MAEINLLSGLMNMGYTDLESKFTQQKYSSHLNNYHLFKENKVALEFASWCNTRDKGHGDFYVYGIYIIF